MTKLLLAHGCSKVEWKFPEEAVAYGQLQKEKDMVLPMFPLPYI